MGTAANRPDDKDLQGWELLPIFQAKERDLWYIRIR